VATLCHAVLVYLHVRLSLPLAGGARDLLDLLLSDAAAAIPPTAWAAAGEAPAPPAPTAADATAGVADGAANAAAADAQAPQQDAAPMETDGPGSGGGTASTAPPGGPTFALTTENSP
jgi:hypothetical protein